MTDRNEEQDLDIIVAINDLDIDVLADLDKVIRANLDPRLFRAFRINHDIEQARARHRALVQRTSAMWEKLEEVERNKPSSPPFLAEFFISFLAPKNSGQAFLGDLQEMFQKNADRFGEKQARRKYLMQVATSLAPLLWQWLKRIGFFTMLVDYVRTKFGL